MLGDMREKKWRCGESWRCRWAAVKNRRGWGGNAQNKPERFSRRASPPISINPLFLHLQPPCAGYLHLGENSDQWEGSSRSVEGPVRIDNNSLVCHNLELIRIWRCIEIRPAAPDLTLFILRSITDLAETLEGVSAIGLQSWVIGLA